jgi:hypothetical protein
LRQPALLLWYLNQSQNIKSKVEAELRGIRLRAINYYGQAQPSNEFDCAING